jgi:hypothetical protein
MNRMNTCVLALFALRAASAAAQAVPEIEFDSVAETANWRVQKLILHRQN